jgi:hypothetical protein
MKRRSVSLFKSMLSSPVHGEKLYIFLLEERKSAPLQLLKVFGRILVERDCKVSSS